MTFIAVLLFCSLAFQCQGKLINYLLHVIVLPSTLVYVLTYLFLLTKARFVELSSMFVYFKRQNHANFFHYLFNIARDIAKICFNPQ